MNFLMIAAFGAAGVLARYGIDNALANKSAIFPISTFAINFVGSFLIGVIYVIGKEKGLLADSVSVAIGVGLLGGFTTFSAYALQTVLMFEGRQAVIAISYLVASPCAGLLAAYAGVTITRHFV